MINAPSIPGLFITATDTEVGKTVVAGAIAQWFHRRGFRVGVCKPVATGCVRRREGLVSEDAEFLAHCADAPGPLDLICPQRYVEPLAPAVAAERTGQPLDWKEIDRAIAEISSTSDIIIVEGIGGLMVPLDLKHTVLDLAKWLKLPTVIVTRANLGTINHTLLTANTLRAAGVKLAGVVVNRYPAESASIAEETNSRAIERWGKVPVLTIVPDEKFESPRLPPGIVAAIDRVDWERLARQRTGI